MQRWGRVYFAENEWAEGGEQQKGVCDLGDVPGCAGEDGEGRRI